MRGLVPKRLKVKESAAATALSLAASLTTCAAGDDGDTRTEENDRCGAIRPPHNHGVPEHPPRPIRQPYMGAGDESFNRDDDAPQRNEIACRKIRTDEFGSSAK